MSIDALSDGYDLFLECNRDLPTLPCSTLNTASKTAEFIKNHKKELFVGAALVAVGLGIATLTGYTFSVAVSGVIVAGAGSIFSKDETTPSTRIVWINGIRNTPTESTARGMYIQRLSDGHTVTGIYNRTHGAAVDVAESVFLNYMGCSPNTSTLLEAEWRTFHEANAHNPNAKLLQICHSQGAFAVKNALEKTSPDIQDRVIVVAIAPAAIVPSKLCFQSYNYASKEDFIPQLSPIRDRRAIDDVIIPRFNEEPQDYKHELILLEPHPEAEKLDHAFDSPTFEPVLKKILENYAEHKGEYVPEEKGR